MINGGEVTPHKGVVFWLCGPAELPEVRGKGSGGGEILMFGICVNSVFMFTCPTLFPRTLQVDMYG